jgi:nucleotide-binding universal stress UspA family protein
MSTLSTTRVGIFDRILCAFDGSPGATDAANQASVLGDASEAFELVGVCPIPASYSAEEAPMLVADAEREFDRRFAVGRSAFPTATAEVLHGAVVPRLLDEIRGFHATLVAAGATAHSRPMGVVRGSVPTAMLHRAPCSVLIARRAWGAPVPRSIVVGYDGSREASEALSVGLSLAGRFDARLRVVLAGEAASIWADELDGLIVDETDRHPVDALCEASEPADLLLVGSRGLRGLKAIGSVSEQLGHRASCSVLVVRDAPCR